VSASLRQLGTALGRLLHGPAHAEVVVTPEGPKGALAVPREGDGVWEIVTAQGKPFLAPNESSYYLYFVLPAELLARAQERLFVEVEYYGDRFGQFRLQYASRDRGQPWDGLYKDAAQRWTGEAAGLHRLRRSRFELPDFDPGRTQNQGASFRLEFRSDLRVSRVRVDLSPFEDEHLFPVVAPLPELRKLPGRFYPINYLFIEITNACNFKCTWCPDEIMERRRGFMKKEKVFRIIDEIAEKRVWLGPLYPVKLHQMGEPMLHPDLSAIVAHAESRGVPIELNTNCGLITEERIEGLYKAGLTNLILSYQTPDSSSFETRKAPRLIFDEYRDKVRLAVERKVALRARTTLEIDIMNTKYSDGYRIVSADEQAIAFLRDWLAFVQGLERKYGLAPRVHDLDRIGSFHFLDQDENGSRYELLEGVHLIWKRCHSWGNVIETSGSEQQQAAARAAAAGADTLPAAIASERATDGGSVLGAATPGPSAAARNTYCPAPYDQFVIQWNGDVVTCCTDYEGRTKTANVFADSVESIWKGDVLKQRKRDMLEGRLLDVCARCEGVK
jgi:MoaA/NifB/PqqE/SkfB family radical SAM enzyme